MKIILRAGTPPLYFWKTFPGISPAARAGRSVFFKALGPGSVGLVHDRIDGQIVAPMVRLNGALGHELNPSGGIVAAPTVSTCRLLRRSDDRFPSRP